MRDGISFARLGKPAVALVTEDFAPQGDFVARSVGMPGVPRVVLPHPVAGTGAEEMARIARAAAPRILDALGAPAGAAFGADGGPPGGGEGGS